jgi:hypothetical protein
MKHLFLPLLIAILVASCGTARQASMGNTSDNQEDTSIVQSLFADKSSSISEENIQRLLDGSYHLPASLKIAIVRLETPAQRRYGWYDENTSKARQSYLDSFVVRLRSSPRVESVTTIPAILLSDRPSFTVIREAAVRMRCNMVLIYSVNSDIYTRYRAFKEPDLKAFATTESLLLDVRTGMIPFSTTITRDVLTRKTKEDLSYSQTRDRVLDEAALATIKEVGEKIVGFLK